MLVVPAISEYNVASMFTTIGKHTQHETIAAIVFVGNDVAYAMHGNS